MSRRAIYWSAGVGGTVAYLLIAGLLIWLLWGGSRDAKNEAVEAWNLGVDTTNVVASVQGEVREVKETITRLQTAVVKNKESAENRSAGLDGRLNAQEEEIKKLKTGVNEAKELARGAASTANNVSGIAKDAKEAAGRAEEKADKALVAWNEAKERLQALQDDVTDMKKELTARHEDEDKAKGKARAAVEKARVDANAARIAKLSGLQRTASQARIRAEQAEQKAEAAQSRLEKQIEARVALEEKLREREAQLAEATTEECQARAICAPRGIFRRR